MNSIRQWSHENGCDRDRLRSAQGQLALLPIVGLCKVRHIKSRYQNQTSAFFEQVWDE